MEGCKPCATPIEVNHRLKENGSDRLIDAGRFQRLVGRLIYLSLTRPNITYVVSVVSQFMHAPTQDHMKAAYKIFRYTKGCPGKGNLYQKNVHHQIEVYTDADYASSLTDRRSMFSYCSFVGGNLVTWRSKKQLVIVRSSANGEFRSMAYGICESLWLKMLLSEVGWPTTGPVTIYCDNKATISIAHDPVQHDCTKHVKVDRHFIKDHLKK